MKSIWLSCAAAVLVSGSLKTDYTQKRSLRVDLSSSMDVEMKSMHVERNGEPVDSPMGGSSSSTQRHIVYVDTTLEHADGAPTKVRRAFEDLVSESSMTFGENQMDSQMKARLSGVTLELSKDGDDVEVKAVEGDADDDALEGHTLPLVLDAFLPTGDSESWELDSETIKRGLALDVQKSLFAPPDAPEGGGESGRGRGRSRGMGGASSGVMSMAELTGKATLTDETEEYEGVECVVIKIEIAGDGDLPEPEGGGGGPRGRAFEPFTPNALIFGSTYDIKLEGRLLFDAKKKLPVHLKLEGSIELEQSSERTFGDNTMKFESVSGGDLSFEASITQVEE